MATAIEDDQRFRLPLYSLAAAARHIAVPRSTFDTWVHGYERARDGREATKEAPIVTATTARRGQLRIPFVGLAEGFVLASFQAAGVPMQRIRPALDALGRELGIEHVLASESLYTDGATVLYDFAERAERRGETPEAQVARDLVEPGSGQRVFAPVVARYLRRITYSDGYARILALPQYDVANVIVDPRRSSGMPIFASGAAQVEAVLGRFKAGESLDELCDEFGLSTHELIDAVRVHTDAAA